MRYLLAFSLLGLWPPVAFAAEREATAPPLFDFHVDNTVYALAIIFFLTFLLTFYVGVLYFRERKRFKAARAKMRDRITSSLHATEPTLALETWQQRALTAEALADNQALLLRERLMPELTEFVKQSLVQGLAAQRDALLAMQQQALQSVVELESRLIALQAPLQERIRTYETRIGELEKDLAAQNVEMRELTRTILELMRKRLAEERSTETTETENPEASPSATFR